MKRAHRVFVAIGLAACASLGGAQQQQSQQQQAHEAGATLGRRLATTENARLRSGETATTTPRLNDASAERQLYNGNGAGLNDARAAQEARCRENPQDAGCAGVRSGTAQRTLPVVPLSNRALVGEAAVRNPTAVVGDISSAYGACTTSTPQIITPAQFETRACTMSTDGWRTEACTKTLDVVPRTRASCVQGSPIGTVRASMAYGGVPIEAEAICDTSSPAETRFRVRVGSWWFNVTNSVEVRFPTDSPTPAPGSDPPQVGQFWISEFEGAQMVANVYAAGPNCAGGQNCSMTFHFFTGWLNWSLDGSQLWPGRLIAERICPSPSDIFGNRLMLAPDACADVFSCPYQQGSASACYRPTNEPPWVWGFPYDMSAGLGAYAYTGAARAGTGVMVEPGGSESEYATLTVNFPRPSTQIAAETWNNGCEALERMTPNMPPDGVASPASPLVPLLSEPGVTRCVKTGSVCADGPATRIIDGVPVTRACWRWENTFQCATTSADSNCSGMEGAGCALSEASRCTRFDDQGRCLSLAATYECQTAAPVFGPVTNCAGTNFCADGSCWETTSPPNNSMALAVSHLQARLDAGADFDPENMRIFTGRYGQCTHREFGARDCCNGSRDLAECPEEDQDLVRRREAGLCHYVGDYCSSRNLLGCRTRVYAYCCFSGVLARAVQQGGHPQIGKSWGAPQGPDCSGFTVDEFTNLNWEQIDLSDWYSRINPVPPDMGAVQTSTGTRGSTNCYYGGGQCGN